MRAAGIETLENKLSEYVRLAAAGETALISDRDQVVAQLGPPAAGRSGDVADVLLADAVRRGLITPAVLRHRGMSIADLLTLPSGGTNEGSDLGRLPGEAASHRRADRV
jgi:hypothetical protein